MAELQTRYLSVIDGERGDWQQQAMREYSLGNNFLLILPEAPQTLEAFCQLFCLPAQPPPKPLGRADLFLLSPHIAPDDFDRLLDAGEARGRIFFVDLLDLPTTHPPQVKPYLVYCGVWGIISQHDDLFDARQSWSDFSRALNVQRSNPEAGIYKWEGRDWCSMEVE